MDDPTKGKSTLRIDAHHHLWQYSPEEFGWLEGDLAVLRRDHLMSELLHGMQAAGVDGTVAVQAIQKEGETNFLLRAAAQYPQISGVVGWLPLASARFPQLLEEFAGQAKLKGLRHVVQAEPVGFLDSGTLDSGIRLLRDLGLTYDLLIHQHQLEEAIRFVDRHPSQAFVLDHLAKPLIASGQLQPWSSHLRELAQRPHIFCKISGMVTEARADWTTAALRPYFDVALDAFTPARLMLGSDWPVLTPRCSYAQWWQVVEGWASDLSESEQANIYGRNAARFYHLDVPTE